MKQQKIKRSEANQTKTLDLSTAGPGNTVRIEPEGDIYNVTEGEQLRMRCSAVCSPPCTYTWYYGYERVKSPDGSLILNGVLRNSSGPFVCYAANDVGLQGSRLVQVDVLCKFGCVRDEHMGEEEGGSMLKRASRGRRVV